MIYCFDTSAFIAAWLENYPPDVTPRLWKEYMPSLAKAGRLIAPEEVLLELSRKAGKDHGLYHWVKTHSDVVIKLDLDQLKEAKRIINTYPRLLEQKPGRNGADPFVISLAKLKPKGVVVTKEGFSGNLQKPKIRDICQAEKIRCHTILEVIRNEKWVFE